MSTHWLSVRFRTESGYTPGKPAISSVRDCASFCSSPLVSQPGFINQLRCSTWIIITKTGIIRKASRAIVSCNDDKSSREKMRNCGTHVLTRIRLSRKGVRGKPLLANKERFPPVIFLLLCDKARPVSRVLSRMAIYPDAKSPTRSSDTAGTERAALCVPYILHRMGFT